MVLITSSKSTTKISKINKKPTWFGLIVNTGIRMVVLGLAYTLFKRIPKGAERGLYAGKGIMHGVKVTFSNKK